jgi:hypothetical protein
VAEDEAQAARDWFVELRRKLETEKGLSEAEAMKLALAMVDQGKLTDWVVQDLVKGTPEERAAFVQSFLDVGGDRHTRLR